jgi:catechol 2,3-dioxygenase-like lactoylglutathione lyase family enzyme
MSIQLDHFIVSSHDRAKAAERLAGLLGVPWNGNVFDFFSAVYINDGLTLDFVQTDDDFPVEHFCFRVDPQEFEAILERIKAAGVPYRSRVRGPVDFQVDTSYNGKGVYWNEPDGHQWEMLTVSYARPRL